MKHLARFIAVAAIVIAPFAVADTANADSIADVHPGMSIATNGGPLNGGSWCTLTAVGHDSAGRLLGLAAGHCIPPNSNSDVKSAGIDGNGPVIGHWITAPTGFPTIYTNSPQDLSHDGAFFEINSGLTVSNQLPNGTHVNSIGSAPVLLQHMCKFGQVTQETCGWVNFTGSPFGATAPIMPGDSGGPAYNASGPNQANVGLIGVTSAQFPTRFSAIQNILADAATQGITGFTPLP
jgi:hypothetical protein